MDKEDVICVYNGILLRTKKEPNSAISREVDRSSDCHTEWSQKEKNIV